MEEFNVFKIIQYLFFQLQFSELLYKTSESKSWKGSQGKSKCFAFKEIKNRFVHQYLRFGTCWIFLFFFEFSKFRHLTCNVYVNLTMFSINIYICIQVCIHLRRAPRLL